ncbi:hypothetical protein AA0113_g11936 [Alternaria arborescens]|uniref:Uncharacterized protein n=1 Tax=Alternaria arborescens TaxID=156630 RepID=A0A4Q4Q0I3_9PLEO|nr:hypothetical protein AA0113_g11936 [Alternaria arborescens]
MPSMISSSISTLPATSTAIATDNSGLSVGAKAGIGVGATLGAIALIGLGIFIAQALRWRKKARDATPSTRVPEEYTPKDIYRYEQGGNPAQLAGGESELHEMPGSVRVSELDQVPYSRPVGGLGPKA